MNKNLHRLFITLIFIAITSAAYLLSNQKNNNTSPPPPISTTSSHLSTTATIILAELKNNPNADPQNTSKKTGPKILTPSTSIPTAPPTSSPPLENQTNTVPVTFIINNQEFALKLKPGSTAYDAMIQLQESKQISFVSKKFSGLGYFIEEINGVKNNPSTGFYWTLYINNQEAKIGVSNYTIEPNDIITWRYESK